MGAGAQPVGESAERFRLPTRGGPGVLSRGRVPGETGAAHHLDLLMD